MSHCVGYFEATYQQVVEAFGEPTYTQPSGDEKVNTEWEMITPEGAPVRIYDWKDYDGGVLSRSGQPYRWHIGGNNIEAMWFVQDHLPECQYA